MARKTETGMITLLLLAMALVGAAAADEGPVPSVDISFGTGLDRTERVVTGEAGSFAADVGLVWCRTLIKNVQYPAVVTHAWYHEGRTMARVELNVGSFHWRTWSSKEILPEQTGNWEVKVLDADGTVLAAAGFVIE